MVRLLVVIALVAGGALMLLAADADRDPPRPAPAATPQPRERAAARPPRLRPARCPVGVTGCVSVTGRVIALESVDPDGDGDLHLVLAGGAVTAPGITVVDVPPALRPRRDPRPGQRVSAAGQVQRGSYGQAQIHATRLRVARVAGDERQPPG